MKKTVKSILSMLLILIFVFCAAACGGKENASDANDDFFADSENVISGGNQNDTVSDSTASNNVDNSKPNSNTDKNTVGGKTWEQVLASIPKNLRGTTIDFYNWNPPSEYTGSSTVMKNFEKETGIKVNWITQDYNTYQTRLASMVAADKAPDFARTNKPIVTAMQSFQPLSATKFDFTDGAWDQTVMKDYSINGKAYATSLNNTHLGSMSVLFYNKALIDNYDFEDPYKLWKNGKWTWEKFLSMSKKFKEEANTKYGAGSWEWSGLSQVFGIGGPYEYDGKKYRSVINDSDFISVTQEIADLYNTDSLIQDWGAESFDRGELLFWSGFSIHGRRLNSYFSNLKNAGTLYAVPLPSVEGQKTYYQGRNEYEAYALVKGAKNPEAVPYFLRYFLDPDNYDLDAFYPNAQMEEVYNWCMSQPTKIWTVDYWDKFNPSNFDGIKLIKGNQVKSFVDSNGIQIENRVNNLNSALEKFK